MPSPESPLHHYRIGPIPVGQFIDNHTEISTDPDTQAAVDSIQELLATRGAMMAYQHRNRWDMLAQGAALLRILPENAQLTVPVAAKYYDQPLLLRYLFDPVQDTVDGLTFLPVHRREDPEVEYGNTRNRTYFQAIQDTRDTPGRVIPLSPYGTTKNENKVRSGVSRLLDEGLPVFTTAPVLQRGKVIVGFSEPHSFPPDTTPEQYHQFFQEQFNQIGQRIHI